MYDSLDGKQAGVLKNIDTTASDSIYAHKDSVTVSTGGPWVCVKAPEFKEPVIIYSPRYSPLSRQLLQQ